MSPETIPDNSCCDYCICEVPHRRDDKQRGREAERAAMREMLAPFVVALERMPANIKDESELICWSIYLGITVGDFRRLHAVLDQQGGG